jgi:hypothetical protein
MREALGAVSEESVVIAPGDMASTIQALAPGRRVEALESPGATALAEQSSALAENLARIDALTVDLSYLSLPTALRCPEAVDLRLSIAAQRVLRSFATGLPGFALSSLPYLYQNFLDFDAEVEEGPKWLVRLGKPPLNLILTMTGKTRAAFDLGWLDAGEVELCQ